MNDYVSKLGLEGKITAKHAQEINEIVDGIVKEKELKMTLLIINTQKSFFDTGFKKGLKMIVKELKDWDDFSFKGKNTTLNRILKIATDQTKEVR